MISMLEMVQTHGYPIKHSFIQTSDGYLLDVYRIPGPRGETVKKAIRSKQKTDENKSRKPILLVHGLLSSSFRFIINGNGDEGGNASKAIAY